MGHLQHGYNRAALPYQPDRSGGLTSLFVDTIMQEPVTVSLSTQDEPTAQDTSHLMSSLNFTGAKVTSIRTSVPGRIKPLAGVMVNAVVDLSVFQQKLKNNSQNTHTYISTKYIHYIYTYVSFLSIVFSPGTNISSVRHDDLLAGLTVLDNRSKGQLVLIQLDLHSLPGRSRTVNGPPVYTRAENLVPEGNISSSLIAFTDGRVIPLLKYVKYWAQNILKKSSKLVCKIRTE